MDVAAEAGSVGIVTASLILGAFVLKFMDFVKYLLALAIHDDKGEAANGLITLMLTWVVGFFAVLIFKSSQWGDEVRLGDQLLSDLDGMSTFLLGLAIPSIAALLYDGKKAIDNTDSASTPRIVPAAEEERQRTLEAALGNRPAR